MCCESHRTNYSCIPKKRDNGRQWQQWLSVVKTLQEHRQPSRKWRQTTVGLSVGRNSRPSGQTRSCGTRPVSATSFQSIASTTLRTLHSWVVRCTSMLMTDLFSATVCQCKMSKVFSHPCILIEVCLPTS